jgi:hypothetical protein
LSGRGLCDELVPRPEESYRLWCVSKVYDHETSTKRGGPGPYRAVEPKKTFSLLMFCRPIILCLLNCVTETIQVTEGGVGQPYCRV